MDLSKISKGGQIWAGAGIVFFIASFLPWYTAEYKGVSGIGGASVDANAWGDLGFLWGSLWALLFLAGIALLVLPAFGVAVPKLPAVAYMAVAGLATVFTLLKLLIGEDVAAAAAAFGGFMMFKESGGELNDLKDMNKLKGQFGGNTGGGTPPPPPPPPGMSPPPPPPPMG